MHYNLKVKSEIAFLFSWTNVGVMKFLMFGMDINGFNSISSLTYPCWI